MRKIERFKKEAMESCKFRGHQMTRFKTMAGISYAYCLVCRKSVAVDDNPTPNGIDIGGEAVAIECGD